MDIWKPHVTVAAVLEQGGRFLLVEEEVDGRVVYNQPAGHLEQGEGLIQAVIRETLEETGYDFLPQAVTGLYRWQKPGSDITYLRVAFTGTIMSHDATRPLDAGILRAVWLTHDEVTALGDVLRSPMVLACIEGYRNGRRYSLDLISDLGPA